MIKCVVWDLDDTLWQGILKEKDVLHLPEGRKKLLEAIDQAGILQSIASRNEKQPAEKQLQEFGIAEYFLYPQYGNQPKSVSIRKIAEALNISLDSLVFLDDSEFELSEVKYFLPEVRTYHTESQWEEFLQDIMSEGHYVEESLFKEEVFFKKEGLTLEEGLFKENREVTYESKNRRSFYLANAAREREAEHFPGTREDFLKECRMIMVIRHGEERDIPRICELVRRTNQFRTFSQGVDERMCIQYIKEGSSKEENLSKEKSLSKEDILSTKGIDKALYVAELSDRFGNYGIIGLCFVSRKEEMEEMHSTAVVEQFCISCRVEGRGVANAFLHSVLKRIMEEMKTDCIQCRFMETDRNMPMLILLKALGFRKQDMLSGAYIYELEKPMPEFRCGWINIHFYGKYEMNYD